MNILGIDYGLSKTGLAFSEGVLADPIAVLKISDKNKLIRALMNYVSELEVEKVVVGVSENEMGEKSKAFGNELKKMLTIPVVFTDETLSTYDAQQLAKESRMKASKRRNLEDAFAAAVMLQNYLDLESS